MDQMGLLCAILFGVWCGVGLMLFGFWWLGKRMREFRSERLHEIRSSLGNIQTVCGDSEKKINSLLNRLGDLERAVRQLTKSHPDSREIDKMISQCVGRELGGPLSEMINLAGNNATKVDRIVAELRALAEEGHRWAEVFREIKIKQDRCSSETAEHVRADETVSRQITCVKIQGEAILDCLQRVLFNITMSPPAYVQRESDAN